MELGQIVTAADGRQWRVAKIHETAGVANIEFVPVDGRPRSVALTEDNIAALPTAEQENG